MNYWPEDMGPFPNVNQQPIIVNEPIDLGNWGPIGLDSPIAQNPTNNAPPGNHLTTDDVKQVLAQGISQASSMGQLATLAVVDRVGNVLAVYRMDGVDEQVTISSTFPATVEAGLDNIVLPTNTDGDALAVIAKAITGAYLSSSGNAFSTRTASQIIQEHFNPGEDNQPSGPLFGVQFSQLPCSDFSLRFDPAKSIGPQRSPLGLSADSGGFPLYKNGEVVGGIGAISDNHYGVDKNIIDFDVDNDELIALAATLGFEPDDDIKANRITLDGKTLRFSDVNPTDLSVAIQTAQDFDALPAAVGTLIAVNAYSAGSIIRGTVFAHAESGIRADSQDYTGLDAFVFVDENDVERFRPQAGNDAAFINGVAVLSQNEVQEILKSALDIANRARAQIRRPLGSQARVTIAVVDSQGNTLGIARTRDAPVFGSDVSLQKARTAAFFSNQDAATFLNSITTPTNYLATDLSVKETVAIPNYVSDIKNFMGNNALSDGTAFSDRAGGNLSRPFYADGIENNPNGPLSKSFRNNKWSVFSTGLQLDLVMNKVIQHVLFAAAGIATDSNNICTETASGRLANGIQIFPGSVPTYRAGQLIGGIGVSGDGVDQDDMIAFLGLHNAAINLSATINNAPTNIRADNLTPQGVRLRYIQCPQSPFIDSTSQNVCRNK
ncbi:MAG: heme-binding protein [Alcanivoracaceae bacterium]|nr:heme-binding protein [Alcanivoracaceae bacterium]